MVILQMLKVPFISLIVMLFVSNCSENTTVKYSGTTKFLQILIV
jgi:hypothetical protein